MARRSPAKVPSIEVFVENLPGNVYRRVRRPDGTYHFEYLSSGLFRQFKIDHLRLLAEPKIRFDWIHPDDRARFIADLEISAATLGLLDHRVRVIGQDERVHWARGIAHPSRRPDGSVVWDGIVIDVTREVEAEAALRLAKDEADRAHAMAARLIADAVGRLDGPVSEIGAVLANMDGDANRNAMARLRACYTQLEVALRDLIPDRVPGAADSQQPGGRPQALTPRQQEVLRLLREGLSNKGIAQKLGITPGTAKLHVSSVLRQINVRSRRQLFRL